MIDTLAFCKSNNSLWLARTLMAVFHLDPSFEGLHYSQGYHALLLSFCREWVSKSCDRLSQLVAIEVKQQPDASDGRIFRCTAQSRHGMFLWPVTIAYEVDQDQITLADVEDPDDTLMIGRNSFAIQHLDSFHIA